MQTALNSRVFRDYDVCGTERWRVHYNTGRPDSSLGYRPPAPAAVESRELTSLASVVT